MGAKVNSRGHQIWMQGDWPADLILMRARIEEAVHDLPASRVEFVCADRDFDYQTLVGKPMAVGMKTIDGERLWHGLCVSAELVGADWGDAVYSAEIRPWLWLLSLRRECRVFQEMSTPDIIQQVLGDYGFSGRMTKELSGSYDPRTICIQYRESDLDFICRLMEEEGIYYFFDRSAEPEKLILADSEAAHPQVLHRDKITFSRMDRGEMRRHEYLWRFRPRGGTTTGKVTLTDYDPIKPKADLASSKAVPMGAHPHKDYEDYDYPGHYRELGRGEGFARVRMEGLAAGQTRYGGTGNAAQIAAGALFTLTDHPMKALAQEYLLLGATHEMRLMPEDDAKLPLDAAIPGGLRIDAPEDFPKAETEADRYHVHLVAQRKDTPYRAPRRVPWPVIAGVQTAVVTGPSGEEIHTDEHGRVKIQFHWDRLQPADDKSSCWVRVATPWSGKGYGTVAVPRMGQEVVVQFEEGDPDRPLITGMLYNADTMPPWGLPGNKTQHGMRSNSSKGGGGYHELMFEDKKGAELVRFQSERDYHQIVKNDAKITVGLEHQDKGDMEMTVHRHLTETLDTGDHTFTVAKGNQTIAVKKNLTETVEGNLKQTVTGNVTEQIKQGNYSQKIDAGSYSQKISMGSSTTEISMGNWSLKTALGKQTSEAMQSIEFKVGANSIKIDQTGITIKGIMVNINGMGMLIAKSPMTTIKGDAMLTLKGGILLIN